MSYHGVPGDRTPTRNTDEALVIQSESELTARLGLHQASWPERQQMSICAFGPNRTNAGIPGPPTGALVITCLCSSTQ
jgi:hypothetical protein